MDLLGWTLWGNPPVVAPDPPVDPVHVYGLLRWATAVFRGVAPSTLEQYTWPWAAGTLVAAAAITGFVCFIVSQLYKLAARFVSNFSAIVDAIMTICVSSVVVVLFAVLFAAMNPAVVDKVYAHRPPSAA